MVTRKPAYFFARLCPRDWSGFDPSKGRRPTSRAWEFQSLRRLYAVNALVLEEATRQLGRHLDASELHTAEVKTVARRMTVSYATDGNHGRSVAQGAQLVGAKCVIFVHSGVSNERIAAIARFGAQMIRVDGNYDDSVVQASRVAAQEGWITVSDTSWPGYERIPRFVMQGYTALASEALRQLPEPPTHVFLQAGVGGIAAAVAGHLSILLGDTAPSSQLSIPRGQHASSKARAPVILSR
ncbi:diaminopropionate ammonia-lyase family [Bradyrhizobium sp. USDA 3650]